MNLKKVLMELGNALVMNHGYYPAHSDSSCVNRGNSTLFIEVLTNWINNPEHPERREELAKLGVEWPVAGTIKTPEVHKSEEDIELPSGLRIKPTSYLDQFDGPSEEDERFEHRKRLLNKLPNEMRSRVMKAKKAYEGCKNVADQMEESGDITATQRKYVDELLKIFCAE
jgi:hypothetical protein